MTYQHIERYFTHNGVVNSAAEAHGLASGMLCVNGQAQGSVWIKQLFEAEPDREQALLLVRLFDQTKASLESDDYDFEPFLPEDDAPLCEQITALIDWCLGFLFGIGALYQSVEKSRQANEILRDIAEFTKLDPDAEGEEDEMAFVEIIEYLRTAVLLLRAEFGSNRRARIH